MPTCTVNGKRRDIPVAMTIAGLLAEMNLLGAKVAVERNGVIVPKSRHGAAPLAKGDVIEIVTAVGGG